jgi:HlyD family secretion protein
MNRLVVAVVALGVVGGSGYGYYRYTKKPTPPTITTSTVTRGDVVESVGATGTLQAVTTVQVGSQVSGNIAYLGADYNSLVKKGQVLAKLDPSLFEAQAQQSRANVAQARANAAKAQSELNRNRVQLIDAQQKYTRAKELSARSLIPQSDLDSAKIAVDTAQAAVESQQATVTQAQSAITQAEAGLNQQQVNLEHTVITAPIDGLVISRSVDVGQTVAASMQAPTLFVLAADLTKMQVVANLDESDVGRIRPNQTVTFRVDAYPQDTFHGTVSQVRLEPKVQQNVVTYATVIDVPNNDLRLKPGMTANVNVEISRASNVLRIPNSALRYRPSNEVFAALGQTPPEPQGRGGFQGGGRRGDEATGAGANGSTAPSATSPGAGSGNQADASHAQPSATTGPHSPSADHPTSNDQSAKAEGSGGPSQGGAQSDDERRKRFAARTQNMSPEEREAMTARLRERGIDPNNPAASGGRGPGSRDAASKDSGAGRSGQQAASAGHDGATTIDALFAPLPRTQSVGRAWISADNQLRPVRLRLGISDGQNTEVIDGDVKEGTAVVTNVVIAGQTTRPATTAFPGFGGGRQGFPGGGFQGGGGRGR